MTIAADQILDEKIAEVYERLQDLHRLRQDDEAQIPCALRNDDVYADPFCYQGWDTVGLESLVEWNGFNPMQIVRNLNVLLEERGGERDEEAWPEDPDDENFWSYFNDIEDGKDRNFEFDIRFTLPKSAFPELTEVLGPMAPFLVVDL